MNTILRPLCLLAVVLLLVNVDAPSTRAQTLNFGGIKVQTNKQSNRKDNDDQDDDDDNANRQSGKRSKSNKDNLQIQQFFPDGQGGQNNGGQQTTTQQKKFNPQQIQGQWNTKQFQNWQQGNQNTLKIGGWNNGKWQGSHSIEKWNQALGGQNQPFTKQWYKDHPKAWKYDNNQANIWIAATLPGVYGWLGWGNVPPQYQGNWGNAPQFDHSHYGDWYPLGVYSLMSGPGDPGTRIVQLVVDRHGNIAGNYYDMITNSNYSLSGNIRQQSQRVSWWLNKNQFVRFRAPLYNLLQPYGGVTVELPGGEQYWQFVRLED